MSFEIEKSDDEWRGELSADRYSVLRKAATEAPFSGSLLHVDADGVFSCGGCHQVLFTSAQKFDSGCGWPSFDACDVSRRLFIQRNGGTERKVSRDEFSKYFYISLVKY